MCSCCCSQVYIANNPKLVSLAGANATLARPGTLTSIGGQLVIGGNTLLTSLAGLENLREVGGPVSPCNLHMHSQMMCMSVQKGKCLKELPKHEVIYSVNTHAGHHSCN